MRNQRKLLRTIGASAALIAALMAITAAQASAAKWSPAGHTATGTDTGLTVQTQTSNFTCNTTTMTMKSAADGFNALTQPVNAGLTFSNCQATGLAAGQTVAMTMAGQWKITPTSTTTASIQIPANGLKVSVGLNGGYCTINIGPTTIDATWSQLTHRLRIYDTSVAHSSSGYGWCPGISDITVYNLSGGSNSGWYFPTFSII
jgi:hypothetical protein